MTAPDPTRLVAHNSTHNPTRSHARHHATRFNPLVRWQRRLTYAAGAALLASGLTWLAVHFLHWPAWSQAEIEGLPSPWEPWLMRVHGAAVMAALFVVGAMSSTHVVRGWRLRRRRKSGAGLLALLGLLVLSGYALYYLIGEAGRDALGLAHAALGLGALGALLWHRRRGRA
jgi:cation transport ATPase